MERKDIQRLLRERIDVLAEPSERLKVISEEFGDWLDSSRRIDLLCIDSGANLVVVELKRTDDGGLMELQALRYAAMISTMTFEQCVETLARYRNKVVSDIEAARSELMEFLSWNDVDEDQFAQDTRIILAAADFSKELTTAVLWLNEREIDIRCVRLKPWRMADGPLLLDVQQLIPLPDTEDFLTKIGKKREAERGSRSGRQDLRQKFWRGLLEYAKTRTDVHANISPTKDNWIAGGIGRAGFALIYRVRKFDSQAELWIGLGVGQSARNKAAFKALEAQRTSIEADFGGQLDWQELPEGEGCRIRNVIEGGYKSPPDQIPATYNALTEAMVGLDRTFRARVSALVF
jgi:hypothetical protein